MDVEQRIHPKAGEDGLRELARETVRDLPGAFELREHEAEAEDTILAALLIAYARGQTLQLAAAAAERERLAAMVREAGRLLRTCLERPRPEGLRRADCEALLARLDAWLEQKP